MIKKHAISLAVLLVFNAINAAENEKTKLKTMVSNAVTYSTVGAIVAPVLAIGNKIIGKESWQECRKKIIKGTPRFAAVLGATTAAQKAVAQSATDALTSKGYDEKSSAVVWGVQVPSSIVAGYGSSIAELLMIQDLKMLLKQKKRIRLIATAGHGAPAAISRDIIYFGGMKGVDELDAKLNNYSNNKKINHVASVALCSIAATVISHPFAYAKTRQQQECLSKKLTLKEIIKSDGVKKMCTAGMGPRLVAIGLAFSLMDPIKQQVDTIIDK